MSKLICLVSLGGLMFLALSLSPGVIWDNSTKWALIWGLIMILSGYKTWLDETREEQRRK